MTNLERLIRAHVEGAVVATVSTTVERVAEEIAREYLKDPAFKAEIQTMVRDQAAATVAALRTNGARRRRK